MDKGLSNGSGWQCSTLEGIKQVTLLLENGIGNSKLQIVVDSELVYEVDLYEEYTMLKDDKLFYYQLGLKRFNELLTGKAHQLMYDLNQIYSQHDMRVATYALWNRMTTEQLISNKVFHPMLSIISTYADVEDSLEVCKALIDSELEAFRNMMRRYDPARVEEFHGLGTNCKQRSNLKLRSTLKSTVEYLKENAVAIFSLEDLANTKSSYEPDLIVITKVINKNATLKVGDIVLRTTSRALAELGLHSAELGFVYYKVKDNISLELIPVSENAFNFNYHSLPLSALSINGYGSPIKYGNIYMDCVIPFAILTVCDVVILDKDDKEIIIAHKGNNVSIGGKLVPVANLLDIYKAPYFLADELTQG